MPLQKGMMTPEPVMESTIIAHRADDSWSDIPWMSRRAKVASHLGRCLSCTHPLRKTELEHSDSMNRHRKIFVYPSRGRKLCARDVSAVGDLPGIMAFDVDLTLVLRGGPMNDRFGKHPPDGHLPVLRLLSGLPPVALVDDVMGVA
jgi:hypothetical protein